MTHRPHGKLSLCYLNTDAHDKLLTSIDLQTLFKYLNIIIKFTC